MLTRDKLLCRPGLRGVRAAAGALQAGQTGGADQNHRIQQKGGPVCLQGLQAGVSHGNDQRGDLQEYIRQVLPPWR